MTEVRFSRLRLSAEVWLGTDFGLRPLLDTDGRPINFMRCCEWGGRKARHDTPLSSHQRTGLLIKYARVAEVFAGEVEPRQPAELTLRSGEYKAY